MLTDEELQNKLKDRPAPRITREDVEKRIESVNYIVLDGGCTTVCGLMFDNTWQTIGTSSCVSPENYDKEMGEKLAYDDAVMSSIPFFAFLLCEQEHVRRQGK